MSLSYNYLFPPLFLTPLPTLLGINLSPSHIKEYPVTSSQAPSLTLNLALTVVLPPSADRVGLLGGEGLPSPPPTNYAFPFWQSFFEGWDATKKKDKVKGGRQEPVPACESCRRACDRGQWVGGSRKREKSRVSRLWRACRRLGCALSTTLLI